MTASRQDEVTALHLHSYLKIVFLRQEKSIPIAIHRQIFLKHERQTTMDSHTQRQEGTRPSHPTYCPAKVSKRWCRRGEPRQDSAACGIEEMDRGIVRTKTIRVHRARHQRGESEQRQSSGDLPRTPQAKVDQHVHLRAPSGTGNELEKPILGAHTGSEIEKTRIS